ncbi:hypothetical protein IWW48_004962 [Coemansia sp. RSA 1200]|nr:hypothetical protein IWW48_004962 [Coemansia sp. RSA 1200]
MPSERQPFQAVWLLTCRDCNVLWSSRGMEAIVMARPAIRCFSTDLPPLGCDVVYQPVPAAIEDMVVDSGCTTCSSITHHARRFDLAPSGPCDCHVQDIACLGCGNIVGYYIHRPCFRCLAQRLRIKQRGFQHLWTFYQDNVRAVQRKNEFGDPVSWEDLPVPPSPAATSIGGSSSSSRLHQNQNQNQSQSQNQVPSIATRINAQHMHQNAHSRRNPQQLVVHESDSDDDPTPQRTTTQTVVRRDEVLEPIYHAKDKQTYRAVPSGVSNWLYQVGIDSMAKLEELSLSR